METSASVDFDTGSDGFAGSSFFPGITQQAQYGAREAGQFLTSSGFGFFAVLLLFVVVALGIWRQLTKGV